MALVEVFHLVASELPINPTSTTDIPQGSVVVLTSGLIEVALATNLATDTRNPVGLAGDSRSAGTTSYTPESGSALNTHADYDGDGEIDDNWTPSSWDPAKGALVMGAWGEQERFTQNRIADNYNEVFSSGKMTVYHSGGEFWTDQFQAIDGGNVQTYTAGSWVFQSAQVAGKLTARNPFTVAATDAGLYGVMKNRVGLVLRAGTDAHGRGSIDYPTGVPGTDTPWLHLNEGGNSMTYGRFLLFKLDL